MDDVLGILYDEHDPNKIISACNSFIREIRDHRLQLTTNHVEVLENCFFKIFLSNKTNLEVLTCIVETLVEFLNLFHDVKSSLSKKGIFFNISQLVQNHLTADDEKIEYLKCGYRLSIALTDDCPEALKEFCNTEIVASILESLATYRDAKDLLILCLHQISILISNDTDVAHDQQLTRLKRAWCQKFFEYCFELDNTASFFLDLLNRYPCDSESLHLFGLKCLKSFAALDDGAKQFCEMGGIDTLCNILHIHFENDQIVHELFTLLKIVLQKIEFDLIAFKSNDLCEIFSKAMNLSMKNPKKLHLLSDSLMTLLLVGSDLGKHMIKNNIHQLLFEAFDYIYHYSFTYQTDLCLEVSLRLARCLFLLLANKDDDIRNEILLDACRKSDVDLALFVLALGASINCRSDDDLQPLAIACKQENETLVKQLLVLMSTFKFAGVVQSRIDTLHSSMEISSQTHNGAIIAALLWYLVNRDSNGEAEWSNCKLSKLKSEWLEIAFAIQEHCETDGEPEQDVCLNVVFQSKWHQLGSVVLDAFSSLDSEKTEDKKLSLILKEKFTIFESSKKCPLHYILQLQENTASYPALSRLSEETLRYASEYKCSRCRGYAAFREFLQLSFDEDTLLEERIHYNPVEICTCPVLFPPVHLSSVDITELHISRNSVTSLDSFVNLSLNTRERLSRTVKRITLLDNKITEIPTAFAQTFRSVTNMNLSRNQLVSFPFELLLFCPHLETLDLSDNLIQGSSMFPHDRVRTGDNSSTPSNSVVSFQHGLKKLKLSKNAVSEFPLWIFQVLPSLSHLEMRKNLLKTIIDQDEITDMAYNNKDFLLNLTHVDLSDNNIHTVATSLLRFARNLKHIDLSENEIDEVVMEEESHLSESKLSSVDISGNHLTEIPRFAYFLPKLKILILSNNNITSPPIVTASWKSKALTDLDLSHNEMTNINPLVSMLAQYWPSTLKKLMLSHNSISEIPTDLGKLYSLTDLDISSNDISMLPDELGLLSNLTSFLFQNNSLAMEGTLPKGTGEQVREFLYERLKESVPHNRVKLILVGDSKAGKTTLLNSLQKYKRTLSLSKSLAEAFSGTDLRNFDNVATVGVNVVEFTLTQDNKSYQLSAWDFAGQEDFYATHPCFISERAMYIALYDASLGVNQLQTLKPWLTAIHARADNCPVFIVGSHADKLRNTKLFTASLNQELEVMSQQEWFPRGAFQSSQLLHDLFDVRKHSNGIPALKFKILNIISESKINGRPLVGNKVPHSYVKFSKLLQEEAKKKRDFPVISFNELVTLLQNRDHPFCPNFENSSELMLAVEYLHQTGYLLHFNEPRSRLHDYFFIQPDWLCKLFAQIVTMEQDRAYKVNPYINKQGILSKISFTEYLVSKRFYDTTIPKEFFPRLFRLLENFEVMLYQGGDCYLVPSRLPPIKPKIELPVERSYNKFVRYFSMAYSPMGLWPRLLARLLAFSDKLLQDFMDGQCTLVVKKTWREGAYFEWRHEGVKPQPFVLIQSEFELPQRDSGRTDTNPFLAADKNSVIEVVVPRSLSGVILLSKLVDHISSLMEEWYSGLLRPDKKGRCLFQQYVPCSICYDNNDGDVHFFSVDLLAESVLSKNNTPSINENKAYDVIKSSTSNVLLVICPHHPDTPVPLLFLAPEINLDDFESSLRLNPDALSFEESPRYLLGGGGFGAVYQATYKGEDVAIKTFHKTPDASYKSLRAELNVLAQHQHPSIISLKGFIPPAFSTPNLPLPLLAMEHAKLGSLNKLLSSMVKMSVQSRKAALSDFMKHRIAFEIADGLCFLHGQNIVYRDLKPDNILLMSLNPSDPTVAKITDYGISTLASPFGTPGSSGSPGYKAPEVISHSTSGRKQQLFPYSIKCDIYSYGLVLHELAVGRSPWINYVYEEHCSEKELNSEISHLDDVVFKGILPSPISTYEGASSWPYAQELVTNCLKRNPEERPTAYQIVSHLSTAQSCCFKSLVSLLSTDPIFPRTYSHNPVDQNSFLRCISYRGDTNTEHSSSDKNSNAKIYYSSKDGKLSSITKLNVDLVKGCVISDDTYLSLDQAMTVSCLIQIPPTALSRTLVEGRHTPLRSLSTTAGIGNALMLVAGTHEGHLIVIDDSSYSVKHKFECAVTSIHLYRHPSKKFSESDAESDYVIIGLADRSLVFYTVDQIQSSYNRQFRYQIALHDLVETPPSFIDSIARTLYVVCGKKVVWILLSDSDPPITKCAIEVNDSVQNFGSGLSHFYLNLRESSQIQAWKVGKFLPRKIINVSNALQTRANEVSTVTSMFVDVIHSTLWVGTNMGRIVIYSEPRYDTLMVVHRHVGPITHIFAFADAADTIACLGEGFHRVSLDLAEHENDSNRDSTNSSFYLTMWDSNLPEHAVLFDSILKARKALKK